MSKSTYARRNGQDRKRFAKKKGNIMAIRRRKIVLENLKSQAKAIEGINEMDEVKIDLSKDHNYKRIKQEIAVLEKKVAGHLPV